YAKNFAQLCGNLPLALRVIAGVLKVEEDEPVALCLAHLSDEKTKFAQLRDPFASDPSDPDGSVEASLFLSYDLLGARAPEPQFSLKLAARSVLCQLGVFPASFDVGSFCQSDSGHGILQVTIMRPENRCIATT